MVGNGAHLKIPLVMTATAPKAARNVEKKESLDSLRRVTKLRKIATTNSSHKVEGVRVDTFSARAFLGVFDAVSAHTKSVLLLLPLPRAINACCKLINQPGN